MITWGLASAATMLAVGVWSLYGIRALTGAAKDSFYPGILLYLTYWFPRSCRARANALFIMGIPATIAIASTLSGFILQMHEFIRPERLALALPAGRPAGGHPRHHLPLLPRRWACAGKLAER